jgi:hypothetical protein
VSLILRLLVTVGILALIVRSIDVDELVSVLAKAQLGYLLIAVMMQCCSSALAAFRWGLLMDNLSFRLGVGFYLRSYFKGMFFNQALPTSIGGDAIRVLDVAGRGFRKRDSLYAVALDRVVGLSSLLVVPIAVGLWQPALLPQGLFIVVLLLGVGSLLGFLCALNLRRWIWLWQQPRLMVAAILSERLHLAFCARQVRIAVASVIVHVLASVCLFATGKALGIELGLLPYLALVPLALLFSVLPVSIAGWGVREGAIVALFSAIGTGKALALAMSLLYGVILMLVSLPGLLVYLQDRRK